MNSTKASAPFRVFLVEDSPLLRSRLEGMIASIPGATLAGHAADAESAVRGIREGRPDAVVLDLHLANGNGFDVLRALHPLPATLAVFVLTNFATDAYRAVATRLGARGFFDKSQEFERLKEALAAGRPARA